VTLAIFDLDNTLIGGDSDHLWGQFVCEQGLVDSEGFSLRNEQFYADYEAGNLDIHAYLRFALGTLKGHSQEQLSRWHQVFMDSKIKPIMLQAAQKLIADHRRRGHELLIITATNRFITEPIARTLGVDNLVACEAEIVNGLYTGEPSGIPSYHAGKVTRLHEWLHNICLVRLSRFANLSLLVGLRILRFATRHAKTPSMAARVRRLTESAKSIPSGQKRPSNTQFQESPDE